MATDSQPAQHLSQSPIASSSPLARRINELYRLPIVLLVVLALLFLLMPFGLAWLDGILADLLETGRWRLIMVAPVIVLYILILIPFMARIDARIITSIRPVLPLDDETYAALVQESGGAHRYAGTIAATVGAIFGILSLGPWEWDGSQPWSSSYILLTTMLMYGLLAWAIVESVRATRFTNALLRQPLDIDVFDLTPFEPIGRQSLMLSFSFVVGITISMLSIAAVENIFAPASMIVYGVLLSFSVLLFFLNMRPTHRVLAAEKKKAIDEATMHVRALYRKLQAQSMAPNRVPGDDMPLADELNAWIAMEERLKLARTWPYNTEMLRTLTVTVLTPIAVAASRAILYLIQTPR